MDIIEGLSYHIKDTFFNLVKDPYLMTNKEDDNYRPHHFCFKDSVNPDLLWMVPISSKYLKYCKLYSDKIAKNGRCDTIVLGKFGGSDCAFLIQNMFPIIAKYLDHVHLIGTVPVEVHMGTREQILERAHRVIKLYKRGIKLIFPDIDKIKMLMEKELSK